MSFVLIKGNPLESWLRLGSRFIVRGSHFSGLLGWWGISHIPSDHKQMCRRSSILFFHYLPSLTLLPKKYEGVKGFPDLYRFVTDHKHFTSFTLLSEGSCEKFHSCHVVFVFFFNRITEYPGTQRRSRLEITSETPHKKNAWVLSDYFTGWPHHHPSLLCFPCLLF